MTQKSDDRDKGLCSPQDLISETYLRSPSFAVFKERLYVFLKAHPNNYSKAAKHFGLTRDNVIQVVEKNKADFEELEDEYLDELEESVLLFATGRGVPEGKEHFRFNEALKVLERKRKSWAAARQGGARPKASRITPAANGVALEIAKQFNKGAQHVPEHISERKPDVIYLEDD